MGIVSKTISLITAAAGLAAVSQAPEFAQQYRQRIGGAVEELKIIVSDFDKDAAASGLTRDEALNQLQQSKEQFSRDRGKSMSGTVSRFDHLSSQQNQLETAHALMRPLFVLTSPDRRIVSDAWEIFEPAVPLTVAGAVYGGLGGLLGFGFARVGISSVRRMRRNKSDTKLQNAIEETANPDAAALKELDKNQSEEHAPLKASGEKMTKGIPASMAVSPAAQSAAEYYKARCDDLEAGKNCSEEEVSQPPQAQGRRP